jgi:hypothetical protein
MMDETHAKAYLDARDLKLFFMSAKACQNIASVIEAIPIKRDNNMINGPERILWMAQLETGN